MSSKVFSTKKANKERVEALHKREEVPTAKPAVPKPLATTKEELLRKTAAKGNDIGSITFIIRILLRLKLCLDFRSAGSFALQGISDLAGQAQV